MNITDLLQGAMGEDLIQNVSKQLNLKPQEASKAVTTAVPLILAGLKKNAETPEGAESLNKALETKHDGSLLDNLSGMLGQKPQELEQDGNGILNHVFGDKIGAVQQGVAAKTGLNMGTIAKLLPMLAPIVMGFLGKKKRQANVGAGGLGDILGGLIGGGAPKAKKGGIGGFLTSFMDKDKDGNVMDDLMDMIK